MYIEDEMIEGLVKRHLDTHEEIYNCDRGIIKMLIISILTSLNFLKFLPIFEFVNMFYTFVVRKWRSLIDH